MKVWLIMGHVDYEGSIVVSVWADEAMADAEADRLGKLRIDHRERRWIDRFDVEERELRAALDKLAADR